jgi:hypothetical protein
MREQSGPQNCRLKCEDDDDHEDDVVDHSSIGTSVPASSDSEHGQGTLDLLRQQLQAAGSSSPTPPSQPRERPTLTRATFKL